MTAHSALDQQSIRKEKDFVRARLVPILIALYQATVAIALIGLVFFAFGGLRTPFGSPQISQSELNSQLVIPMIVGVILLGCGIWVFVLQHRETSSRIFAVFTSSMALAMAVFFHVHSLNRLNILWILGVTMAAGTLVHLAWIYPTRLTKSDRWRFLPFLGYGLSLVLLLLTTLLGLDSQRVGLFSIIRQIADAWLGIATVLFITLAALRGLMPNFPLMKQRGYFINLGTSLSLFPYMFWVTGLILHIEQRFTPVVFISLLLFPLIISYALLRFHLPSSEYLLSQGFLYAILTVVSVSGYAMIVSGLGLIFNEVLNVNSPIFIGLMFFLLAILLNPLRDYLQNLVDTVFYRGELAYQTLLQKGC